MTRIGSFGSRAEADLVRSLLESEGIPARVVADDAGQTGPDLAYVRRVSIQVHPAHELEARRILNRAGEWDEDEATRRRLSWRTIVALAIVCTLMVVLLLQLWSVLT